MLLNTENESIWQSPPIVVEPSNCTNGPITVSGPTLHVAIDDAALGLKNRDSLGHQLRRLAGPQDGIERGQFGPGIHPQHFAGVLRLQASTCLSGAPQDARQVSQIKLVVRIVGA